MPCLARRALLAASLLLALPLAAVADDAAPAAPPAPGKPAEAPAARKGVAFEAPGLAFAEALAKAKAASKSVFVDFSTEWCGWCRRLEQDVFGREDVAKAMEAFVCLSVDAEKGEGVELAKRYGAHGYPTLVVVDAAGDEVDRIVGYLPPDRFLAEIARIGKGEGTLPALKAKVAAEPENAEAVLAYAEKLAATQPTEADRLLEVLGEKVKGKDRALEARVLGVRARFADEAGDAEKAGRLCDRILDEFADTEAATGALLAAVEVKLGTKGDHAAGLAVIEKVRAGTKDGRLPLEAEVLAARIHAALAGQALARAAEAAGEDAERLNEVAWTAFEMRVNLRAAVAWARKAAELSKDDPEVLDTLANLLAVTGKLDEAIEIEERAAAQLDPASRAAFEANVARWKAELAVLQAADAVPATPLVPAPSK